MSDEPNKIGRPKKWTRERIDEEADALREWLVNEDDTPHQSRLWLKEFAISRGYDPHRCIEWNTEGHDDYHEVFSALYARAKQLCELNLVRAGLVGMDAKRIPFIKLMLESHHDGWTEQQRVTIAGDDEHPVIVKVEGEISDALSGLTDRGDIVNALRRLAGVDHGGNGDGT